MYGYFLSKTQAQKFVKDLMAHPPYREGAALESFDRMRLLTLLDAALENDYLQVGDYPGTAIDRFTLAAIPLTKDKVHYCLAAHFCTGAVVKFSPKRLFSASVDKDRVLKALRTEVRSQILAWRKKHPWCDLCGAAGTDVDHYGKGFHQIALEWLVSKDLHFENLPLKWIRSPGGEYALEVLDEPLLYRDWYQHHKKHAQLRTVCARCHPKPGRFDLAEAAL